MTSQVKTDRLLQTPLSGSSFLSSWNLQYHQEALLSPRIGKAASILGSDSGLWPNEKWLRCAWNEVLCAHFSQQNGGRDKAARTTHRRAEETRKGQVCNPRYLNIIDQKLHAEACMHCFINKMIVFISKCFVSGQ